MLFDAQIRKTPKPPCFPSNSHSSDQVQTNQSWTLTNGIKQSKHVFCVCRRELLSNLSLQQTSSAYFAKNLFLSAT